MAEVPNAEQLAEVVAFVLNARRAPEQHDLMVQADERGRVLHTVYDEPGVEVRFVPGTNEVQVMFGRTQDANPEVEPPVEAVGFSPDFTITVTEA